MVPLLGRATVRPADESARVTTFELFFDLVFVFAFTQVIALMAATHSPVGVLQALVVLGLMYEMWGAYCWLGNQAPADQPVMRVGMSVAMIGAFVAALAIPEAYDDLPVGWHGPIVLAPIRSSPLILPRKPSIAWRASRDSASKR